MITKKGFTLIELLVVIAIIGILASIVLVSLSGARNRARDARIQSAMAQMRTLAEIHNSDTDSYIGLTCIVPAVPAGMETLCADVDTQNGTAAWAGRPTVFVNAGGTEFCAFAVLASGVGSAAPGTRWFCIDEGKAVDTTTNPATAACTAATSWDCP